MNNEFSFICYNCKFEFVSVIGTKCPKCGNLDVRIKLITIKEIINEIKKVKIKN